MPGLLHVHYVLLPYSAVIRFINFFSILNFLFSWGGGGGGWECWLKNIVVEGGELLFLKIYVFRVSRPTMFMKTEANIGIIFRPRSMECIKVSGVL